MIKKLSEGAEQTWDSKEQLDNDTLATCKECNWKGISYQLDRLELNNPKCPECGSNEINYEQEEFDIDSNFGAGTASKKRSKEMDLEKLIKEAVKEVNAEWYDVEVDESIVNQLKPKVIANVFMLANVMEYLKYDNFIGDKLEEILGEKPSIDVIDAYEEAIIESCREE